MTEKKTWLITGAGRGLGLEIARAALAAGHRVVATGRDPDKGFFRTSLLTCDSTTFAATSVADYAERTKETVAAWKKMDGTQPGDPARLAEAIVQIAGLDAPPQRFAAGVDAVQAFEARADTLIEQANAHRALSSSLAYCDVW